MQIFCTSQARDLITSAAKKMPIAAPPLSIVAFADWGTSVGFRRGINALFDVQVICSPCVHLLNALSLTFICLPSLLIYYLHHTFITHSQLVTQNQQN
jgi:hypothetical protein